ncbi:FliH/SctL family protein [Collimonas sp.]|jgi:flagellar biosynthesis/type III secretory pathway protein FliH|uniref:FliH/SctL family protein n=1 Tax=Collimonas sp. TaxID=1963772 RepID=UPI002C0CDB24|nr:FliH/SctL family protein [Collimonas sp.]HWW05983.1 FliH/SctL family protein [Collimonas sp.]
MTGFCTARLVPDSHLRAEHGVLRASALLVTSDAGKVAAHLLQQAQVEQQAMLQAARAEAQLAVHTAQEQVAAQATQLLATLNAAHATLLERAQGLVIDLAQQLFERLVMAATPREQVAAVLRRLQFEAPPKLLTPLLWVHPDDFDLVPQTAWELKADPSLARGACKLEASNGEWRAEFGLAAAALKSALTQVTETSPPHLQEEAEKPEALQPEALQTPVATTAPQ